MPQHAKSDQVKKKETKLKGNTNFKIKSQKMFTIGHFLRDDDDIDG